MDDGMNHESMKLELCGIIARNIRYNLCALELKWWYRTKRSRLWLIHFVKNDIILRRQMVGTSRGTARDLRQLFWGARNGMCTGQCVFAAAASL